MAGRNGASFLKRQKEQKRLAKAAEKRDARRQRQSAKGVGDDAEQFGSLEELVGPGEVETDAEATGGSEDRIER